MSEFKDPKKKKRARSYWSAVTTASPIRRVWGRVIVAVLFCLPLVAISASVMLGNVIETLGMLKMEDPALTGNLVHQLQSVGMLFLAVIVLLSLLGIYFVFFVSVSVYGPQVALVQFINQIKAGNYTPFRELRKEDQLQETWRALQDLATHLRERESRG